MGKTRDQRWAEWSMRLIEQGRILSEAQQAEEAGNKTLAQHYRKRADDAIYGGVRGPRKAK